MIPGATDSSCLFFFFCFFSWQVFNVLLSFLQIPQSEFMMKHVFASLRSYINKVNYLNSNQPPRLLCYVSRYWFVTFKWCCSRFSCYSEMPVFNFQGEHFKLVLTFFFLICLFDHLELSRIMLKILGDHCIRMIGSVHWLKNENLTWGFPFEHFWKFPSANGTALSTIYGKEVNLTRNTDVYFPYNQKSRRSRNKDK